MKKTGIIILLALGYISSYASPAKTVKNHKASHSLLAPVIKENSDTTIKTAFDGYRASATILTQLVHTKLEVSFDWNKQWMYGKATITLQPYYYATDSLVLDAKGYDIHEVSLVKATGKTPLKYKYDSKQLHITLDKKYTRKEK